jgi:hypothetical protein
MFRVGAMSVVFVAVAVGFWGCGSSEYARCTEGQFCDLRLDNAAMITECEHFARDNCLHGLASGETPRASDLGHCVAAIKAAGTCAHHQGSGTLATDCEALLGSFASGTTTVCDIVLDPEDGSECGFLTDKPVKEVPEDAAADTGSE